MALEEVLAMLWGNLGVAVEGRRIGGFIVHGVFRQSRSPWMWRVSVGARQEEEDARWRGLILMISDSGANSPTENSAIRPDVGVR